MCFDDISNNLIQDIVSKHIWGFITLLDQHPLWIDSVWIIKFDLDLWWMLSLFCREVNETIWFTKWIIKACAVSNLRRFNAVSDEYSPEGIFELEYIGIAIPPTTSSDLLNKGSMWPWENLYVSTNLYRWFVHCKSCYHWSNWIRLKVNPHIWVFLLPHWR